MSAKRNRWLVGSVLIVALAAFLSISLLPLLSSIGNSSSRSVSSIPTSEPTNAQEVLEQRARGYELVLEREPQNQAALEGLVETRIQLMDLAGTIEPLETLADIHPDQPEYRVILGQTKQQLGDLEGAAESYRRVLSARPGNMDALRGLTALLVQQQRPQAAIGVLQDTLQTADRLARDDSATGAPSIDVISVKILLGEMYVVNNQIDSALTLYDEMIQEAGQDFRPVYAKALVLQSQGRQEEADPLFAQAQAMAPAQYKDQIAQRAASDSENAAEESIGEAPEESAPEATE